MRVYFNAHCPIEIEKDASNRKIIKHFVLVIVAKEIHCIVFSEGVFVESHIKENNNGL